MGSAIIIGPETRHLAGIVSSCANSTGLPSTAAPRLQIYELLGMAAETNGSTDWIEAYEAGLASWRARDFTGAITNFKKSLEIAKVTRILCHDRALQAAARESRREDWTARPSRGQNRGKGRFHACESAGRCRPASFRRAAQNLHGRKAAAPGVDRRIFGRDVEAVSSGG